MNYIKQNHLSLLIILWLVVSGIFFTGTPNIVVTPEQIIDALGAINRPRTTVTNPWTFEQGVIINTNPDGTTNSLTVNGTSTVACSKDGFIASADFTIATGTAKAKWTNTCGANVMCMGDGAIYFDSTAYSPQLSASVGTSTSATGASSRGILASTTVATSTDTMLKGMQTAFYLPIGSSILGELGDLDTGASSTNYTGWDAEFGFPCWLMGQ